MAYLKAAEMGLEVGQSNAAWMLARGYGAAGPAASALAQKLHQRAAGQVSHCLACTYRLRLLLYARRGLCTTALHAALWHGWLRSFHIKQVLS